MPLCYNFLPQFWRMLMKEIPEPEEGVRPHLACRRREGSPPPCFRSSTVRQSVLPSVTSLGGNDQLSTKAAAENDY